MSTAANEAFARLQATFGSREELHPDLAQYYEEEGGIGGGAMIRHPLFYSILHAPTLNGFANAQYLAKRKHAQQLHAAGEFRVWVWLHERPYRLWAFGQIADLLSDHHYWQLLGKLWVDSENIYQSREEWLAALHSERPRRWAMMSKDERDWLRTLKARRTPLLIYRGFCYSGAEHGLSWTVNRVRAEWFARRFANAGHRARVAVAVCDIADVIACFSARGEEEIVVLPEKVHVDRIRPVRA